MRRSFRLSCFLYTRERYILFLGVFSRVSCVPCVSRPYCSLFSNHEDPDTRYLDSLSLDVGEITVATVCGGGSMRAPSVSLSSRSPVLVSENFPVMSFVGRFPSRTEKLNAKVLSDIQCLRASGKGYAHGYVRIRRVIINI